MKKMFLYVCALVCTMGLMTSCENVVTPEDIAGVYDGTMDFSVTIGTAEANINDVPNHVTVTKVNDVAVDIALDLNLSKYLDNPLLEATIGEAVNFGEATFQCAVTSADGVANLVGTTEVDGKPLPLQGTYENDVLSLSLGVEDMVNISFKGTRAEQ